MKFKITENGLTFSKGKGSFSKSIGSSPEQAKYDCDICKDSGECPNDDIYDCVEYLEVKEGKPKGTWMIEWMKRLKEKESEEPYVSDFVKWSRSVKDNVS